jgi:hypothetical protein
MDPRSTLPSGTRWSGPFIVSATAAVVCVWVVLTEALPMIATLFVPHADEGGASAVDRALERHQDLMKTSRDRFSGRSLFVMPPPPERRAPPAPPAPPPRIEPVEPPPPPPPPATYTGAPPKGAIGTTIVFDTFSVRVGEEKNGIKVLGIEPPSNVRIEYMGGTYSVPIWAPTDLAKLGTVSRASSPPGIERVAPSTPEVSPDPAPTPPEDPAPIEPAAAVSVEPVEQSAPAPEVAVEPRVDAAPIPAPTPAPAPVPTQVPDPSPARAAATPAPPFSPVQPIAPASSVTPSSVLPEPLTAEQVRLMPQSQVVTALARVSRARQLPGLDAATQARLRQDFDLLRARRAELPR